MNSPLRIYDVESSDNTPVRVALWSRKLFSWDPCTKDARREDFELKRRRTVFVVELTFVLLPICWCSDRAFYLLHHSFFSFQSPDSTTRPEEVHQLKPWGVSIRVKPVFCYEETDIRIPEGTQRGCRWGLNTWRCDGICWFYYYKHAITSQWPCPNVRKRHRWHSIIPK